MPCMGRLLGLAVEQRAVKTRESTIYQPSHRGHRELRRRSTSGQTLHHHTSSLLLHAAFYYFPHGRAWEEGSFLGPYRGLFYNCDDDGDEECVQR